MAHTFHLKFTFNSAGAAWNPLRCHLSKLPEVLELLYWAIKKKVRWTPNWRKTSQPTTTTSNGALRPPTSTILLPGWERCLPAPSAGAGCAQHSAGTQRLVPLADSPRGRLGLSTSGRTGPPCLNVNVRCWPFSPGWEVTNGEDALRDERSAAASANSPCSGGQDKSVRRIETWSWTDYLRIRWT